MKLKLQFKLSGKKQLMPLNNQYPLSAWIYKVLNKADKQFATILHENGYKTSSGKQFKLFTFSKINFPPRTWKILPKSDRMQVWARKAYLTISFQLPEQTEKFVIGLFQEQKIFIGDKITGIEMEVESIEAIKDMEIERFENVEIRALTAIVLGIDIKGKKNEQYVTPLHPEYKALFLQNLLDKYEASGKKSVRIDELDFAITKIHKTKKGNPKTELQKIKAFTEAQTEVKGHYFDFKLTAPKELIKVGLNSGFGSMNSLGFGLCEVLGENLLDK